MKFTAEKSKPKPKLDFYGGLILTMIPGASVILRSYRLDDMERVVKLHQRARLEFGFDEDFDRMVEGVVKDFTRSFDSRLENCWIAETDGEPSGCVFLVKKSDTTAQLRLLLVDSRARGAGIGRRLVNECVIFARKAGYRTVTLGTNDIAGAARHLYEEVGFRLVHSKPGHAFGRAMMDEIWELEL